MILISRCSLEGYQNSIHHLLAFQESYGQASSRTWTVYISINSEWGPLLVIPRAWQPGCSCSPKLLKIAEEWCIFGVILIGVNCAFKLHLIKNL